MSRISRRKNIRFLIWSLVLLSLLAFIVISYDVYDGVIKFSNEPLKETKLGNRIKRPSLSDKSSNAKANEDNKDQKQSAKSSDKNGGKESEAKDSGDKGKQSSQANDKNNAKAKPQKSQNAAKPDSPKKTQKSGKIEKEEKVEATDKAEKSPAKNADKQKDDKSEKLEENASKYKSTPRPKLPAKPTEKEEGSAQDQKGSKLKSNPKDAVSDFMNEKFGDHSNDPKNPNMFLGDTEPNEGSTYDEVDEDKDDADKDADKDEYNEADNEAPHFHESEQEGTLGSGIVPDSPLKPVTIKEKPFAEVPEKFDEIQPLNFRVYSHNVKNGGHEILVSGERTWAERVNEIASSIAFNARHDTIVALQEVYKFQLDNLLSELNRYSPQNQPEWAAYGAGRIDGRNIGEYVPVLYKTSEWELVFSDTMWLNDKNPRMSLEGWDAKYLRICSYVTLKHKRTENYFNVFNTHFDHVGELSRIGSASMIVQKMNEINKWPSIFCGDLNAEPKERTYQLIVEDYKDVSRLTTAFNRYGHSKSSVTGFGGEVLLQGGQNIDYIFAPGYTTKVNQKDVCDAQSRPEDSPEANISLKLQAFAMLHSKFNGAYMSDHRPLVADFILENKCK